MTELIIALFLISSTHHGPPAVKEDQFKCLETAIYFEARSEPVTGQIAVGQVILNRVKSNKYPGSICKVVNQSYQFSFVNDLKHKRIKKRELNTPTQRKVYESIKKSARIAIEMSRSGVDITGGATHYHATKVKPNWSKSKSMKRLTRIDNHIFYKER